VRPAAVPQFQFPIFAACFFGGGGVFSQHTRSPESETTRLRKTNNERPAMNITSLLNKARKELESAKARAVHDGKAAETARQTAITAKTKLKYVRKLAKYMKKAARKTEDQAEKSLEALDQAQARLEKLEKRARKKARLQKPSANKAPAKPALKQKPAARKQTRPVKLKAAPAKVSPPAVRPKPAKKPQPKKTTSTRRSVKEIVKAAQDLLAAPADPVASQTGSPAAASVPGTEMPASPGGATSL
jgi:hypothetical protein